MTILAALKADAAIVNGEHYAGILINEDGTAHHVILLAWEANGVTWSAATELARKAGGDLPTRAEQALLYANLKKEFKPNWYWSGEQSADYSDYAWCQGFNNGSQGDTHKDSCLRARAVRRLVIQ